LVFLATPTFAPTLGFGTNQCFQEPAFGSFHCRQLIFSFPASYPCDVVLQVHSSTASEWTLTALVLFADLA
jgi:hypothetical protein